MKPLSSNLRSQLERTVIAARDVAEEGAWAALQRLAVDKAQVPGHLSPAQRELRVRLRARGRQLGDVLEKNGEQDIYYLHHECAYEYWHQMLFARFLAENQLLMHPDGVAVSLEECEELAADEGTDGWTLAARYASRMLPQIFRPDDPLLAITFAPEDKQALEKILADLPTEVFTADDSLGWVYQFWQTKRKKEVNDSGEKIGADELPAVTQLFTEDYMVKFLLHNTLGAWWAGRRLSANAVANAIDEEELREAVALPGVDWEYLRFVRGEDGNGGQWRPAAGTFDGWPKHAAELKIMDPCCGSGHFLVAAFDLLVRIRMHEEGLSAAGACDAALRDNLHGLEIDPRCTQIAAFALALAAWTFPDAGGYRELSEMHIACSGISPQSSEEQWIKLAEESGTPTMQGAEESIRNGLINLHGLFSQAPTLGSLIDPTQLRRDLIAADYVTLQPYLAAAMATEHVDQETHERVVAAAGMAKAAELLAQKYDIVATNVPYLLWRNQSELLRDFCQGYCRDAKNDLAVVFVHRCLGMIRPGGGAGVVLPSAFLFLKSYIKQRNRYLRRDAFRMIAILGPRAFETISGEVVNVSLMIVSPHASNKKQIVRWIDASKSNTKAVAVVESELIEGPQSDLLSLPDRRMTPPILTGGDLLATVARPYQGLVTGDDPRLKRSWWELSATSERWVRCQSTVKDTVAYGGRDLLVDWTDDGLLMARRQGVGAWGGNGVAVSAMSDLPCTIYTGNKFDVNTCVLIPEDQSLLPALWAFCESGELSKLVRKIDTAIKVTTASFVKIPFDPDHWATRAAATGDLPAAHSPDPTQWIFHGWPKESTAPLQVAVARLLGYRWLAELDAEMWLSDESRAMVKLCETLLPLADEDGIVCLPAVVGERTASDRLKTMLSAAGVAPAGDLDDWLRDKFFDGHCQLFQQRPFIWHVWDGRRKDGFHALVNYHKLDRKLLEKLIYSHLGDWIARQKAAEERGESGAEARRLAAEDLQERLKLILEGEPPYDIFARWKPLEEQPIGWKPDLNDGVRVNIRPFVNAGVLRKNPKVKWNKDRGKEPERSKEQYPWFWGWDEETDDFMGGSDFDGNRWNDCHYSNHVKQAARATAK